MSSFLQLAIRAQDCLKMLMYILRKLLYLSQIIEIFAVFYHLHNIARQKTFQEQH